ncbi:hypothetical protein, partial [Staphylococcus hominis]|uniref:hypothetical protein n=1 Tax=Staphylococcus hominis TaxID=1290 RepID=UPI0011A9EAB9
QAQPLTLYNYTEPQAKQKAQSQEQNKQLTTLQNHHKPQQIISIKHPNQPQQQIPNHLELFKYHAYPSKH